MLNYLETLETFKANNPEVVDIAPFAREIAFGIERDTFKENVIKLMHRTGIDYSRAKFLLSSYKNLDSKTTTPETARKGLHVFRTWAAHVAQIRRGVTSAFIDDGLIIYEDFFPTMDLNALNDYMTKTFPISVHKRPDNLISQAAQVSELQISSFMSKIYETIPQDVGFSSVEEYSNCMENNTFFQRVHNKPDDSDNQKNVHIDTFFPAVKWWYFTQDVRPEDGAFVYGASPLTADYLQWYYEETIKISENSYEPWKLIDHAEGSLRASEKEYRKFGVDVQPVAVKAGTLVIANVGYFHGRGHTTSPFIRHAIHGSIRTGDPFTI